MEDGFCLEYIPPAVVNGKLIGLIEKEDVESEILFWESSIACYVVGANPPLSVMEGFLRRIWRNRGIERIVAKGEGIFIVRFESIIERDEVLSKRVYYFDKKPLIVKPWKLGEVVDKNNDVAEVPICVQFPKLDLRFWGSRGLIKVVTLGKPLKADKFTKEKKMVNYARILIEIDISKKFLKR